MADIGAKIAKAKQAGYSDAEITAFLAKDASVAPKINQARQAGYDDKAIVGHLTKNTPQARALSDARRNISSVRLLPEGVGEAAIARARGATFGFLDEAQGATNALATGAKNIFSMATGQEPKYGMREAYDAGRQASLEQEADYARRRPVSNVVQQIAGGSWVPGAGYIGKAKSLGDAALRSARVGAVIGGVTGAGTAESGQRLRKATEGAALGAGLGGATPIVARGVQEVARRAGSAASEAASRVRLGLGGVAAEPTARQVARAGGRGVEYVASLAKQVEPGALSANAAELAGKPVTAAEAIGRPAVTQLAAVARRPGKTGEALESTLRQRQAALPSRVLADLEEVTGLSPDFIYGDHVANAASLRAKAAPLYEAAYQQEIPDDPRLLALMQRPASRRALRNAVSIAKEEGRNPEALGLTSMDTFKGFTTGRPPPSAIDPKDLAAIQSGKAEKPQGKSLIEFMAKNGGIKDFGGELRARDLDIWHKNKPFMNKLLRPDGLGEEAMAQKAFDAGYFPEKVAGRMDGAGNMQPITAQELRDAVSAELAGKPRFARAAVDPTKRARLDDLERRLLDEGADPRNISAGDAGRVLGRREDELARLEAFAYGDAPGMSPNEPVATTKPTMQTLDYIKRGLDDVLNGYRDKTTGKLNLDERGRAVLETLNEFKRIIAPTGSAYRNALDAGGDPIRLEQAFRGAKQLMGNNTPMRVFDGRFGKLSLAEKQSHIAGFVNDAFEAAQNGRLRLRDIQQPLYARKLERMLGPDRAKTFLAKIELEAKMARTGGRMVPGNGSPTMELEAASADQQAAARDMLGAARTLADGRPVRAVLQAVASPVVGAYRGAQTPIDQATRDEVGRLLQLSPSELDRVLNTAKISPRSPAPRISGQVGNIFARSTAAGNADQQRK